MSDLNIPTYSQINNDRFKERRRAWALANKDKIREYNNRWRNKNRERLRQQQAEYNKTEVLSGSRNTPYSTNELEELSAGPSGSYCSPG